MGPKKETARSVEKHCGRIVAKALLLLPLLQSRSRLGRLGLDHPLLELIDPAGGIDELLRAGVKRVADVADAEQDHGPGRTRLENIAASAADFRNLILRMYVSFHNKGGKE